MVAFHDTGKPRFVQDFLDLYGIRWNAASTWVVRGVFLSGGSTIQPERLTDRSRAPADATA